ncbi:MAG TPA: Gfo/Idh/MocA family oxidoreductase [Acidobacteriaceae bacterium]|jgi:predicted dehydrogenase|nr:Gfo/Idh/MocA family oxidoreductase [Acidobacteriaceae bacterium]
MTDPVRIGIAGAGFAAKFHLKNMRRVYRVPVEVTGVTARSASTRDSFAQQFGVRAFESFSALCDASDVISLCTPPSTHEELAIEALRRGKHLIIEKPLTGFFGPPGADPASFRGNAYPKEEMLRAAVASCSRIAEAAQAAGRLIGYAENWIYAPAIQKETELVTKSGAQILWMLGNQSHSGSHSPYYGQWRFSGGGSLVGKSCHPLSATLYLKRAEGTAAGGRAIRPVTVSARTHEITRLPAFRDLGFLRTGYQDIEDYGQLHITFSDGTVADIFASELMLGGVSNWLEVIGNNHRTRCNLNPIDALDTFIAQEDAFRDVYLVEKLGTNQGWSHPAPDEAWQHGYPQEFQDFVESFAQGREPASGLELARDTMATIYAGYLSAERKGAEVEIPKL